MLVVGLAELGEVLNTNADLLNPFPAIRREEVLSRLPLAERKRREEQEQAKRYAEMKRKRQEEERIAKDIWPCVKTKKKLRKTKTN